MSSERSGAIAKACVSFWRNDRSPKRKTDVWEVWRLRDATHIGQVRWHSDVPKYCFFPSQGTALDPKCLGSIAEFIESEMAKHFKGRRAFLERPLIYSRPSQLGHKGRF